MSYLRDVSAELIRPARDLANASARLEALAKTLTSQDMRDLVPQGEINVPHQPGPRLYQVPKVVEGLAVRRGPVYELFRTGQLESIKIGRARRVSAAALTSYIASLGR